MKWTVKHAHLLQNSKKINHWDGVREVPVGKSFLPDAVHTVLSFVFSEATL